MAQTVAQTATQDSGSVSGTDSGLDTASVSGSDSGLGTGSDSGLGKWHRKWPGYCFSQWHRQRQTVIGNTLQYSTVVCRIQCSTAVCLYSSTRVMCYSAPIHPLNQCSIQLANCDCRQMVEHGDAEGGRRYIAQLPSIKEKAKLEIEQKHAQTCQLSEEAVSAQVLREQVHVEESALVATVSDAFVRLNR